MNVQRGPGPLFSQWAPLEQLGPEAIQAALASALEDNFADVNISIVDCPDLRKWGLASPGLGGKNALIDLGGVPNLLDPLYHHLSFPLADIAASIAFPGASIFGSSAADAVHVGCNAELMPTENLKEKIRASMVASVDVNSKCELKDYASDRVGYLGNLFASEGAPSQVFRVEVRHRTTAETNFVTCMREGLEKAFPKKAIGMGGVFQLKSGNFMAHVMPDFKSTIMVDGPEVEEWLNFYEFEAGATYLSTFLTRDPTLDNQLNLRLEHTHFFNKRTGQGGHYHYDTTPSTAHYVGYFVLAHTIHRLENAFDRTRCSQRPPGAFEDSV